jgi:hypothetical protein
MLHAMKDCLLGISPASGIKSRRFGTQCPFHLQQVMKCEWGQAGNCPYLYGKRVVGERWSGPIRGEGRGRSSGSQEACGHGGWGKYISLMYHWSQLETPEKYPEDNLSLQQHGESLKSRRLHAFYQSQISNSKCPNGIEVFQEPRRSIRSQSVGNN